jgi:hypothetical protein
MPRSGSEIVSVTVGDIAAQCPDCGETRFARTTRGGGDGANPETTYRCASCNRVVPRGELLKQIGEEATRRSRKASQRAARGKPSRK